LLAAGLLSVVAVRRRQQRRARPAGRRLPARAGTGAVWVSTSRGLADQDAADDESAVDRLQEDLEAAAAEVEAEAQLLDTYDAARQEQQTSTAVFAEVAAPETVLHLDVMLRLLAVDAHQHHSVMPQVHAARLDAAGIELYLAQPATLPAPWRNLVDDGAEESVAGEADTTWLVSTADAEQLVRSIAEAEAEAAAGELPAHADASYRDLYAELLPLRNVQAPYPTLTSIGTDPEGAIVMLNLEELSSLALAGPTVMAHQVLRAIAMELATSSWADDLHVTLVGDLAPELPKALGSERVSHTHDVEHLLRTLEQSAHDVSALMAAHQMPDLATARAHDLDVDAWTPQLILVGQPLDSDQHRRLQAVVHHRPRVGLAAITTQGEPLGEWVLGLHARTQDAELRPGPVPLYPTRLDDAAYTEILQELQTASSRDWTPGPDWALGLVPEHQQPEALQTLTAPVTAETSTDSVQTGPTSADTATSATPATNAAPARSTPLEGLEQGPVDELDLVEADRGTGVDSVGRRTQAPPVEDTDAADVGPIDVEDPTSNGADVLASAVMAPNASSTGTSLTTTTGTATTGAASPTTSVRSLTSSQGSTDAEATSTTWTTMTAEQILTEHTQGPVLAFMGPPILLGARGEEPTGGDASKKTVLIAHMLYLALTPHPSRASYTSTFWNLPIMDRAASKNCASSLSRIRRWLGVDGAGQPYVPKNQQIKLQGVTTDHDVFLDLIGCDVASTPLPDLIKALQLVRGLPFQGGRSHDVKHKTAATPGAGAKVQVMRAHYGAWTEDLRHEIRMQIVDVALHVASVALHRDDLTTARRACAVGLRAEPHHTLLIETALRAAAAAGDEEEVNRMIIDHHLQLKADELEPAMSTLRLEADLLAALETR